MEIYYLYPGIAALVFLIAVTCLQRQVREAQFLVWQFSWGALLLHTITQRLSAHYTAWTWLSTLSHLFLLAAALLILITGRKMYRPAGHRLDALEAAILLAGVAWIAVEGFVPLGNYQALAESFSIFGLAAVLTLAAVRFTRLCRAQSSAGGKLLVSALYLWVLVLVFKLLWNPAAESVAQTLVPGVSALAEGLLGLGMILVITEYENLTVRENALALSTLEVESGVLLTPQQIVPAVSKLLAKVLHYVKTETGILYVAEAWRGVLPGVELGVPEFLNASLQHSGAGEELCRMALRRGGVTHWKPGSQLKTYDDSWQMESAVVFAKEGGSATWTALALESRGDLLGMILFPHDERRKFGNSERRLLLTLAAQLSTTLDNYVLMNEALHRSRESQMMTQVGQVISSHLDPDEVLKAIHVELGKLFDTGTFFVAFLEGDMLHFEFATVDGVVQPKHILPLSNSLAGYILQTGDPLLIRSSVPERKKQLGITSPGRGEKSFLGVPVKMGGRTAGVLCALNCDREFVYTQRDLEVLTTAAGQLSVAMENALLFSEANRRAKYLTFLNTIASTAISSQDAGQLLSAIVWEIEKNFGFDHISVGIVNYASNDIEIRAEAGKEVQKLGRKIPVGVGIMGRVARSNEMAVVQHSSEQNLLGVLDGARSILCMPLHYGGTLLGLLNVESLSEDAFSAQDVLLFNTLADLLATSLNNALVFQRLQQQAITDSLTGVKTRRFFMEALQSEWKRSQRSGHPFAIILVDLDKFKEVNDTQGHLQGDMVLARVASILEMKCRQSNVVARYGGDEFVVLMPETTAEQALILAERLCAWQQEDLMLREHGVTGSYGVASYPQHGETVEEIIRVADDGMYQSKHAGGDRVSIASPGRNADPLRERRQYLQRYLENFCAQETQKEESLREFVAVVERVLEPLPLESRSELAMESLLYLVRVVEQREHDKGSHGEDVASYAEVIGRKLGMNERDINMLHVAGVLHDVGKLFVPVTIFNHPGMLSATDFQTMMTHSRTGAMLASLLPDSAEIQVWIEHHHERMDGSGYPDQLAGKEIPLCSRILGICDAYTMMTSEHPFAAAQSPAEALHVLENLPLLYDSELVALLASHVRGERRVETEPTETKH